jgi:hypothetical protein
MAVSLESLTQQLELADQLLAGRDRMFEPQDLPGRYGRLIRALDHLLQIVNGVAVLAGRWAVWRHGYLGRVTQDVDIVVGADRIDEFLRAAAFSGFDVLPQPPGRWPKLMHKETGIKVDILPEGQRPGTTSKPAPTTLPHPSALGAGGAALRYITLPALIELKLAAGRARDESDVIELVRANPDQIDSVRQHLSSVHADYVTAFDRLVERAREQRDE